MNWHRYGTNYVTVTLCIWWHSVVGSGFNKRAFDSWRKWPQSLCERIWAFNSDLEETFRVGISPQARVHVQKNRLLAHYMCTVLQKNCEGGTHGTEIGLANEIAVKLCNFKIAWCHYMGDKLCLYPRWTLSFRRRARRQISLSDLKDLSTHITQNSNNIVLRTLSSSKHHSFVAIAVEYGISSHNVSFKKAVWQTFSSAVLAKC